MILLTIGGIPISVASSDAISQTYTPIGGVASLRTMGGGLIRQRNWSKVQTQISVSDARLPPALQGLDWDAPHIIKCVQPRAISASSPIITVPSARRTDVAPYGFAMMPDGRDVPTPATLAGGGVVTLAEVVGAARYTVCYVPQMTMLITEFTEHGDVHNARRSWDLTAEEI